MVRNRPRNESATNAPRSGNSIAIPDQALMFSAAVAVDCPSGPVRQVIRLELIPQYANLSATSTPTRIKTFSIEFPTKQSENRAQICSRRGLYLPIMNDADLHPPESARITGRPLQSMACSTMAFGSRGSSATVT